MPNYSDEQAAQQLAALLRQQGRVRQVGDDLEVSDDGGNWYPISEYSPTEEGVQIVRSRRTRPRRVGRSYGVKIFWIIETKFRDFTSGLRNLREVDQVYSFYVGGDRQNPTKFGEFTTNYIGEVGVTSGGQNLFYLFAEPERIVFHAGVSSATADSPEQFIPLNSATFVLTQGGGGATQSAAQPLPYGPWTGFLEEEGGTWPGDTCIPFLPGVGVGKIAGGYWVGNIIVPLFGERQEALTFFYPLRPVQSNPSDPCQIPGVEAEIGKAIVYPMNTLQLIDNYQRRWPDADPLQALNSSSVTAAYATGFQQVT